MKRFLFENRKLLLTALIIPLVLMLVKFVLDGFGASKSANNVTSFKGDTIQQANLNTGPGTQNNTLDQSIHVSSTTNKYNSVTNNYNRFPARAINDDDVSNLKNGLPDKEARVLVQYLSGRTLDTLFYNQLMKELKHLGYRDVISSAAPTLPDNLHHGRLTIRSEVNSFGTNYKVIINPQ